MLRIPALIALMLACAAAAATPPQYEVTALGTLKSDRDQVVARDINAAGAVVGDALTHAGHLAFIWLPDRGMHEIGTRSGGHPAATAEAVNTHLEVVGASGFARVRAPAHAFGWHPEHGMNRLDEGIVTDQEVSRATDVNAAGRVVGVFGAQRGNRAFVWDAEQGFRVLLDGAAARADSRAEGINAAGHVTGSLRDDSGRVAFRWDPERGLERLATAQGWHSVGSAINADGDVAGRTGRGGEAVAAIWEVGADRRELGVLDEARAYSEAVGLNATGVAVGRSLAQGGFRAFVWSSEHGMRQLDRHLADVETDDIALHGAVAVNDSGAIAAFGRRLGSDRVRSFLLTPVDAAKAP